MKKKIELKASSSIDEAWYCEETSLLSVLFKGGSLYEYKDVPLQVVLDWKHKTPAFSSGSYFYHMIRSKNYKFKEIKETI